MPMACTEMPPAGVRCRHQSASQPPAGAPARLASCTNTAAVTPAVLRLMPKRSNRNFGIHERRTTATKFAHMNAPNRQKSGVREVRGVLEVLRVRGVLEALGVREGGGSSCRKGDNTSPSSTPRPPKTTNDHRQPWRSAISPAKKPPPI